MESRFEIYDLKNPRARAPPVQNFRTPDLHAPTHPQSRSTSTRRPSLHRGFKRLRQAERGLSGRLHHPESAWGCIQVPTPPRPRPPGPSSHLQRSPSVEHRGISQCRRHRQGQGVQDREAIPRSPGNRWHLQVRGLRPDGVKSESDG